MGRSRATTPLSGIASIDAAIGLELRPGQERFVAPVVPSIAEAYVHPAAWPRVVFDGDRLVGFVIGLVHLAPWDLAS